MSTNTHTTGVSIDQDVFEVAKELLPNFSAAAQQGVVDAINKKLKDFSPEARKQYTDRIGHVLTGK